jgi:hypothetical protein
VILLPLFKHFLKIGIRTLELISKNRKNGVTLNTGEITVLQHEVQRTIDALRKQGFIISALHNHWLFERPRLLYIHIESIQNGIVFARKLSTVLQKLK